eukprot:SAG11_NODE_569_length_8458_cov_5.574231_9_plen_114_part_00
MSEGDMRGGGSLAPRPPACPRYSSLPQLGAAYGLLDGSGGAPARRRRRGVGRRAPRNLADGSSGSGFRTADALPHAALQTELRRRQCAPASAQPPITLSLSLCQCKDRSWILG